MKYKVGDHVRIKSLDWYNKNKDSRGNIDAAFFDKQKARFCGSIQTIANEGCILGSGVTIYAIEDAYEFIGEESIEGLVEEPRKCQSDFKYWVENYITLPDGYIFEDENGNVINATKIVLEKKKKDVNLTQEQINKMVHDSCVLFCKHCGCGIPRDTCTSLGTCKEHDEYRATIRTHLMEKKKKEYPKTYKEAFDMLGYRCDHIMITNPPKDASQITKQEQRFMLLTIQFQKLLTCRNAYWKIAGEEMGLGKPWKPEYPFNTARYAITNSMGFAGKILAYDAVKNYILEFPTEEMRDAFYENFKELIEQCKELL